MCGPECVCVCPQLGPLPPLSLPVAVCAPSTYTPRHDVRHAVSQTGSGMRQLALSPYPRALEGGWGCGEGCGMREPVWAPVAALRTAHTVASHTIGPTHCTLCAATLPAYHTRSLGPCNIYHAGAN